MCKGLDVNSIPFVADDTDFTKGIPRPEIVVAATLSSNLLNKFSAVPWTTLDSSLACIGSLSRGGTGVTVPLSQVSVPSVI